MVGYENYIPAMSSPDFSVVVHDPYGRFDPSLLPNTYGARRWTGGMSLASGGQAGPGQNCRLAFTGVGRQRQGDSRRGTYPILSARR